MDLFGKPSTRDVGRADKIAELKREIRLRQLVYPQMVARGKLTQDQADRQVLILQAILEDYQGDQ